MTIELLMLGGAGEIGANSCYININGHGIIIDAGLHPRRRDRAALPELERLGGRPVHSFILTHAHTDHVGALPYVVKTLPALRMITTRPTRDLVEIMLRNTMKLFQLEPTVELPAGALDYYTPAMLETFSLLFHTAAYEEPIVLSKEHQPVGLSSMTDSNDIRLTLYDAGHIIGSAALLLETNGSAVIHTGDIKFSPQALLNGSSLPKHHVDCLIIECTNGADESPHSYEEEKLRLARFINHITNQHGSVLLPTFALGKTQEVLKIIFELMQAQRIPVLPIFTGGMSKRITKIYDRYAHTVPRREPGFLLKSIPLTYINYETMMSERFFREPSIVIVSSGMLNEGSPSYQLAQRWVTLRNFGIGIMGYQDPSTPGYALLHSERGVEFSMGGVNVTRECELERFRFSAHAQRDELLEYIFATRPKHLVLVHGDTAAIESVRATVQAHCDDISILVPEHGVGYQMEV
ncbi:MAG: MBL fold metallo-hydrolase [Bacteroidota bacterium]|nr:MBL fold metallo-hydrolase [Candidatus Kapabacteria bacterium]MDW8220763.1 MBL fold metallo-hydrolase [Bacteroidota bacterium]